MKLFGALAALLVGCSPRKLPPPDQPGTSVPLSYPILLLGSEVPTITVVDSESALTTTTASSSINYITQRIVDSAGGWYEVKAAAPVGEVPSPWKGMGTVPYRVFLETKFRKKVSVDEARNMVLENVRSPRSELRRPAERLRNTTQSLESYRTLAELMAGCATQSGWLEHVPKWEGPQ